MGKHLIFILGGARSGKSAYAQRLAEELGGASVAYVATAEAGDDEMRARIDTHRAERPAGWRTVEAPRLDGIDLAAAAWDARVVLLDCVTLLVSNAVIAAGDDADSAVAEAAAGREVDALLRAYEEGDATWIVISNEVGMGLVPPYPLGRVYRDALGRANQRIAATASRVVLMVAGLPWELKRQCHSRTRSRLRRRLCCWQAPRPTGRPRRARC
jgi:adenosylcobinamide kinase/adenosylcobinamide-phosphate guanylyltransferase